MIANQLFQNNKSGTIDHDDPGAREQVWVQLRNRRVVQTPLWNASLIEKNLEGFIVSKEEAQPQYEIQENEAQKMRKSIDPQGFIDRMKEEHPERENQGVDPERIAAIEERLTMTDSKLDQILAALSSRA